MSGVVSEGCFEATGCRIVFNDGSNRIRTQTRMRSFLAMFGINPFHMLLIWRKLREHRHLPRGALPMHMLWALMFLKTNCGEAMLEKVVQATAKTIRKWKWKFVIAIGNLKRIVVSNLCCYFIYIYLLIFILSNNYHT